MTTLLLKKTALTALAQSIALKKGHRSQWSKSVSLFAAEIIADCEEWAEGLPIDLSAAQLEAALLRGANDWAQYFSGACGRHIATVELSELLYTRPAYRRRFINLDPHQQIEVVSGAYQEAANAVKAAYFELIGGLKGESVAMAIHCLMDYAGASEVWLYRTGSHVTQGGACFDHYAAFRMVNDCLINVSYDIAKVTGISTDKRGNLLIRSFHGETAFITDKLKAALEASPFIFEGENLPVIRRTW